MGYRLCEAEFTRNLHVKLRCFLGCDMAKNGWHFGGKNYFLLECYFYNEKTIKDIVPLLKKMSQCGIYNIYYRFEERG